MKAAFVSDSRWNKTKFAILDDPNSDTHRSSDPIAPLQAANHIPSRPGAALKLAPGYFIAAPLALKAEKRIWTDFRE
jgi:hypothetical protein